MTKCSRVIYDANNNPIITKRLYPIGANTFALDMETCIEVCSSQGASGTMSISSINGAIGGANSVTINSINILNSGLVAIILIAPDGKSFTITFTNFSVNNQGSSTCKSSLIQCCRIIITLGVADLVNDRRILLNMNIIGSESLEALSSGDLLVECSKILEIKGPISNNFNQNIVIEAIFQSLNNTCYSCN